MLIDAEPLPGYPPPYDLLSSILLDGTNEWRMELGTDLPQEAMVWQPHPGLHSIGGVILHIAAVEVFWFEKFVLDRPYDAEEMRLLMAEETDVDGWRWPTPHLKPLSWYLELHDRIRARTLQSIKSWPAADVKKESRGVDHTMRWVLGHVIQHEAYHGGQAVLLGKLWQMTVGS